MNFPRLHTRTQILIQLIVILTLVLSGCAAPASAVQSTQTPSAAYVEAALLASDAERLSVIVTASTSQAAKTAVQQVAGEITSDLWLVQAVAATISARQLTRLARQPGIVSIVANKGVGASNGPQCDPNVLALHGPCAARSGWVTDRREKSGESILPAARKAPLVPLPDGRIVSISSSNSVVFLNPNGSVSSQVEFPFKSDGTTPVAGADGSLYFTTVDPLDSTKKILYALNGNGAVRWSYEKSDIVPGGVAVSPDGSYVYLASQSAKLWVFDALSGQRLVEAKPSTDKPGLMTAAPLVGPDGTVYVQTSGKEPDKTDRRSNLIALDPAVFMNEATRNESIWRYVAMQERANGDLLLSLDFAPVINAANTTVYAVSGSDKAVIAINRANGALGYLSFLPKRVTASPLALPNDQLAVPAEEYLYFLDAAGQIRSSLTFATGKIILPPLFSADGSQLFVAAGNTLHVIDPTSGGVVWRVAMNSTIATPPIQDHRGNLIVGSEGKDVAVISPTGVVTSRLWMEHSISGAAIPLPDDSYLVPVGDRQLVTVGFLPDHWDNRPDAEPADDDRVWRLSNPIGIDVGADVVHERTLPDGTPITGKGVTIAVLDSGVYFDNKVRDILGADLDHHFLGQVDFVEYGLCEDGGTQYFADSAQTIPLYCYARQDESIDLYGHGSHVAGIIWSQILDYATGVSMGIAPDANILSVRILDENGAGTYADAIEGLQYVVANKDTLNIRIINMSLSAHPSTPYFIDPLNRAVEQAWAHGLVVVAAAGNDGPEAHTISVPGNDPYVITVGALNNQRTPGYWADDLLPTWTATGPTLDGFVKPDILAPGANITSFMYNVNKDGEHAAKLALKHPDYARTSSLFRMNGTSMATAVVSSIVALMLQANPSLTPDQVKYRLGYTALPAQTDQRTPMYNIFQQGMGRVWAPSAVLAALPTNGSANQGMDLQKELNDYTDGVIEFANHYQGPVRRLPSDDNSADLYYIEQPVRDGQGNVVDTIIFGLGATRRSDRAWIDWDAYRDDMSLWSGGMGTWAGGLNWLGGVTNPAGMGTWAGGMGTWAGGMGTWAGGMGTWAGGMGTWAGGMGTWAGGMDLWSGTMSVWSGGMGTWAGGMGTWAGGMGTWAGGMGTWAGTVDTGKAYLAATHWVNDDGTIEEQPLPFSAPSQEQPPVYPDNVALCPASVTLRPIADSFIDQAKPGAVYAAQTELLTRPQSGMKKQALYRFDLSALPGDALIQNAQFQVVSGSSRGSHAVVFRALQTPWDEATVSWSQPRAGSNWANGNFSNEDSFRHIYDVRVPVGGNTAMSIDVTGLAKDWHTGRKVNAGIALMAVGVDTGDAKWYTREESRTERQPHLRIDFIDPTEGGCPRTTVLTTDADTYIDADRPGDRKGGDSKLKIRPEAGKEKMALVHFDLSGIPANVPLKSATFSLTSRNSRSNHQINIYRMLTAWDGVNSSFGAAGNGAGWAAGSFSRADYAASSYGTFAPVGGNTRLAVDVTALVNDWLNHGAANQGILLLATGSDTGDSEWYSGNEGDPSRRPQLVVEWVLPPGRELPAQAAGAFAQPIAVEEEVLYTQHIFLPAVSR